VIHGHAPWRTTFPHYHGTASVNMIHHGVYHSRRWFCDHRRCWLILRLLGLWGPKRARSSKRYTDGVSNANFPYMTAKYITVGDVPLLASRVTYVGELGWEFYCRWKWIALVGHSLGSRSTEGMVVQDIKPLNIGLEKGYRYWSSEISPTTIL